MFEKLQLGQREEFPAQGQEELSPLEDPGNPTANFHGEKPSSHMHESKSDPDAQLGRKGAGKGTKSSCSP